MKITSRTRYAVIAVLHLAREYGNGPVTIGRISEAHGISVKYLENIMRSLATAGVVRSTKGKKGGYVLSKTPGEMSVYEVFVATEGRPGEYESGADGEKLQRLESRLMRDVWCFLGETISQHLKSISFQGMIEKQNQVYSTLKRLKKEFPVS